MASTFLFPVLGAVYACQQFQRTAEVFLLFALYPVHGSLPTGILSEEDPNRKGTDVSFLCFDPRSCVGYLHLSFTKTAVFCEGLGKLHSIQQSFHLPNQIHQSLEFFSLR